MRFLVVLCAVFFVARPAAAQLANPGFESGDFTSWSAWGYVNEINMTSPIAGTADIRKGNDPTETGFEEAGIFQDDATVTTGRARAQISFVVETALSAETRLSVKIEYFGQGGAGLGESEYVIANASTPLGATITNFVAGDVPATTTFSRFTVLLSRASGTGGGVVRLDDAVFEIVAPGCGDRIVDSGLGETCDTAELASDTTVGACRLDCSGFVPEPVVDAGVMEDAAVSEDAAVAPDASTSADAGPDAGTIERRKDECAASPGSDAAPSWSVLFLLCVAVCASFRRTRHAG